MSSSPVISSGESAGPYGATRFCGLLARRCVWLPTWRGGLFLMLLLALAACGFVVGVHPFLAVDAPVPSKVMVVEGWIPMTALRTAAGRFRSDGYEMVCTVGTTVPGETYDRERSDAVVVADQLLEMGLPAEQVFAVPSGEPLLDRTYTSARVLHDWFLERGGLPAALNVVTVGPHSRRSRLLFEKAFENALAVGVISAPVRTYDASHWWRYSEGVKDVLSEGAAYLYARFLFHPA